LGCAQLEQLPLLLEAKRRLHGRYVRAFDGLDNVRLMNEPANCRSNFWLNALILDVAVADQRDTILAATNDAGLMTRPAWVLNHRLSPFRNYPRMQLPVA